MSENVLSMPTKWSVVRGPAESPTYLTGQSSKDGVVQMYGWTCVPKRALQFSTKQEADDLAARVAGGATAAELVAV